MINIKFKYVSLGLINELKINNKTLAITDVPKVKQLEEVSLSMSLNECYFNPCQNLGECIPSLSKLNGFRCECRKEFQGEFCQIRSKICGNGGKFTKKSLHLIALSQIYMDFSNLFLINFIFLTVCLLKCNFLKIGSI